MRKFQVFSLNFLNNLFFPASMHLGLLSYYSKNINYSLNSCLTKILVDKKNIFMNFEKNKQLFVGVLNSCLWVFFSKKGTF